MTGPASAPAIYFLSDYGTSDEFAGVVRAVLQTGAPGVPVIDLSHHVPHFDVAAGAATLFRAAPYLGPGAVLAVVDPGVGTSRRGVALRRGGQVAGHAAGQDAGQSGGKMNAGPEWWVGPDNGLLVPAVESLGSIAAVHVLNTEFGSTFDGRDVFAPAVARLVGGGDPAWLGEEVDPSSLVRLPDLPSDHFEGAVLVTSVTHIDSFGNAQFHAGPDDLDRLVVPVGSRVEVELASGQTLDAKRVEAFGDLGRGEFGMLVDGNGHLALVLDRSSAADHLGLDGSLHPVRLRRSD
jgi:S-adenosyl-L-methionine hydrolase (adenosine-forming)